MNKNSKREKPWGKRTCNVERLLVILLYSAILRRCAKEVNTMKHAEVSSGRATNIISWRRTCCRPVAFSSHQPYWVKLISVKWLTTEDGKYVEFKLQGYIKIKLTGGGIQSNHRRVPSVTVLCIITIIIIIIAYRWRPRSVIRNHVVAIIVQLLFLFKLDRRREDDENKRSPPRLTERDQINCRLSAAARRHFQ